MLAQDPVTELLHLHTRCPPTLKKLAQLQKVELMRMRHRAVPADPKDKPGSVGVDQRLHVKASCRGDTGAVEKTFWFRKVTFSSSHLTVYSLVLERGHRKGTRCACSSF
jgi:hypothetical protein